MSSMSPLRTGYSLLTLAASLLLGPTARAVPQQVAAGSLRETLARTGVFFRADAPATLRNRDDPHLPVCLEIINGVEKTGKSALSVVRQYVSREPLKLEGVNIFVKPAGARRQFVTAPLLLGESQDFSFDARTGGQPFVITDRLKKTLEIPREALEGYLRAHYLGGPFELVDLWVAFRVSGWPAQNFYLRVRLNAPELPRIPNWYRGDMHYHSAFTDNPAERGHPLDVTKQAALHAGLNWVHLADHSTDLNPERWAEALREVARYRDGRFLFIRGEELTLASAKQTLLTSVHMVALSSPDDPDKGFPVSEGAADSVIMTGDGSVASPAMPVKEALQRIAAAGGFAYAAHPFDPVSPILRGGSWDLGLDFLAPGGKALQAGLVGLQPWNRSTTMTADDARDPYCIRRDADPATCFQPDKDANHYTRLEKGIELGWRPLLLKGLGAEASPGTSPLFKVFVAAGTDAHGDFNYEATMDAVDFLSKPSRGLSGYAENNVMGKLTTVVHCPSGMGRRGENVLQALRQGQSVISNGPLLIAGFDRDSNGSLDDAQDISMGQEISSTLKEFPPLQLYWTSSKEFGPLKSLRLIVGSSSGESGPEEIPIPPGKEMRTEGLYPLDLRARLEKLGNAWGYVRLEARTASGAAEEFRCYTNPIWVRVMER
jgi:hypothetical protein